MLHPILAACVLLMCLFGHHHHGHVHARPVDQCAMVKGFNSWGNQDDFVRSFPLDQQHRVLVCLDKLAKTRGLQ
jgi:hypothetical protein